MSVHVEDKLWAHARGQLAADLAQEVTAHLAGCASCRHVFEQFQSAVAIVKPVQPRVLDDGAWSRIDSRVMSAARKELARGASPFAWFFDNWRAFATAGALAAAAVLAFVFITPSDEAPKVAPAPEQRLAKGDSPPLALPKIEGPAAELPKEELVASASGATRFIALPDGSRAGAVGDSRFTVKKATGSEVRLALDHGTLVVAAAHVETARTFAVAAGEVEVVVVGTRFLVERDEAVTVVVEEGRVEVAAHGEKHLVAAGETLVIDARGKSSRNKAVTPAARAAFKLLKIQATTAEKSAARTQPAESQASLAQRLSDDEEAQTPAEGGELIITQTPGADGGTRFGALTPPPLLLPGDSDQTVASSKPAHEEKKFDLLGALKRIDLKNINLDSPYPPVGMPMAEYRVHQLQRNADRGQCDRVVERADGWMNEFGAAPEVKDRSALTRAVLFTKARCLSKLGRTAEAQRARAAAEAVR